MLQQADLNSIHLLPGLFRERMEINRTYLKELKEQGLLQSFYLEAGIVMPGLQVLDDPSTAALHWGWDAPTCQLRGHFTGHWMSAAAMLVMTENDRELKARLENMIDELDRCRILNGGQWLGSIPEKYFSKLERREDVWSPQYVMHKTLMGLYHCALYAKLEKALTLASHLADWYLSWTDRLIKTDPDVIYRGEAGGMLEIWAGLYQLTGDQRYMTLAERYSNSYIFHQLEEGGDPLSNSHANASIPWAHGAAKMYEITGDEIWLRRVQLFWNCAVKKRESYCTGGQNAGEFWVPPHRNGAFIGERNQEFCTVYNMVRLADYLFRFTKDASCLDYIEKNLYNGFLAQQNQYTAMPTYFLPMQAGSRKKWGSKTHDFWCCHGTMVQAQTLYPTLCCYQDGDEKLIVAQYIPSEYCWKRSEGNVLLRQSIDMKYYNDGAFFDETDDSQTSRWMLRINVHADTAARFALQLRIPAWVAGKPVTTINGERLDANVADGFITLDRVWHKDSIQLYLPASLTLSTLPDRPEQSAVLEGPIVLAGLCDADQGLSMVQDEPKSTLMPRMEHTYATFPWQQSTYETAGQQRNILFKPLYEITDEAYTLYFTRNQTEQ